MTTTDTVTFTVIITLALTVAPTEAPVRQPAPATRKVLGCDRWGVGPAKLITQPCSNTANSNTHVMPSKRMGS